MSTEIKKLFFSSTEFAVVGASKDQTKFGTKVLKWYKDHDKVVTPIHPKEDILEDLITLKRLSDLPSPPTTSVSIITPAVVTLKLLKEAKELGIAALWLQPGTDNEEVRSYIVDAGLQDKVVFGGPCILVEGEGYIKTYL
ncbi:NAD(P)-binding protein [Hysterangium stoloniferum]|nr:NAD(P)-binding protein [Hysterangium stoloniferum]